MDFKHEIPEENRLETDISPSPGETSGLSLNDMDVISSIVLFGFGLFSLISGIYICFFAVSGTNIWYYSPGFFPLFIGVVLILLSTILFIKKTAAGGRLRRFSPFSGDALSRVKTLRLIVAVG